ncbi:MAG: hypothetical protein QMC80_03115 [Thermoplasmatales archaeon]|nr:hypothetical protein [Thermoplasmatales archaeon]
MVKKEKKAKKRYKMRGTARGSGTTYSVLYSTARSPGTKYSTVKDRAKELAVAKRKKK